MGGPADALVRPATPRALAAVLTLAADASVPVHVLGGGFNTLVRDEGFRGVVVHLEAFRSVRMRKETVVAQAGATHSRVTRRCAEAGRAGLEFAVGIPGTVGGWVVMNAGVPDREMRDVLARVEVLLPGQREPQTLEASRLRFRYRATELPEGAVVVGAEFRTKPDDPDRIRERMSALLAHRRRTQPVDRRSCGSVFKNPEGDHAGRLIEAAGLKGRREGGAEISPVHANFIVNRGGATASDVLRLIETARSEVSARFGVELEPEVRVLGAPA